MINTFTRRCARSTLVYRRAWNQNLLSVKYVGLLNLQQKDYQTLILGRVFTNGSEKCNKILSNNSINFKKSLKCFSTIEEEKIPAVKIRSDKYVNFAKYLKERDDFTMSNSEWEKLMQDITKECPESSKILDSAMMVVLRHKPDLSLSFYRYIKSKNEPNMSTLSCFFRNCAVKYEDIVLEEFEKCKETVSSSKLLKRKMASAILLTREWKQVIDWLVNDKTASLSLNTKALITSLKHKDYMAFYDVWTKTVESKNTTILPPVSSAFFEIWKEGCIPVDLFLELLKLEDLTLSEEEMQKLQLFFESEWSYCKSANLDTVDLQSRICRSCGCEIPKAEPVVRSIIEKMYNMTVKNALVGDNIFKKTSPAEVDKFLHFMERHKSFDYVVDGRNLVPVIGRKEVQLALELLTNLIRQGKRVLVISKGNIFKGVNYPGPVFLAHHQTYDDIFMLLAAFMSGPNCRLVTNDDFSEHIALMGDELKPYFFIWRSQQRVFHKNGKMLLHPAKYKFRTSETEDGWHVPCRATIPKFYDKSYSFSYLEMMLRKFLCVKKTPDYVPSPELVSFRKITEDYYR